MVIFGADAIGRKYTGAGIEWLENSDDLNYCNLILRGKLHIMVHDVHRLITVLQFDLVLKHVRQGRCGCFIMASESQCKKC